MAHAMNNTRLLCLAVALLLMSASLSCNANDTDPNTYCESASECKRPVHDYGLNSFSKKYGDVPYNCGRVCDPKDTRANTYCEQMWECKRPVHDYDQRKCRELCVSKGYNYLRSYCEHHPEEYCCCHK
ncbi:hypothetical protein ZWY2020_016693 [Hordeum vulgare]|nr:hypothetical protein ZWY2020_016693 [Hordeum vulgare]